jgi:SPP1 family predicted phage head-tail adaptor
MLAGPLDRRIALRRSTKTQDATGQEIETWSTLATVWASRRRASSRETLAAAEVSAAITDVFEIRYDSSWGDISPLDRVEFEGRDYDIASVDEIGRREGFRIAAVARAE